MQLLSNIGLSVPHPVRRGGWLLLTLLTVAVMVSSYAAAIVPCNAQPPDGYDFASTHMSIAHIDALQRRIVNTHVLQDRLFMAAATWFSGAQYFERSTDTVTFEAHLEAVSLNLPHIDRSGEIEITASTRVGELSTAINTLHWNGPPRNLSDDVSSSK